MNKTAQIRLTETVAILFIFFILVVFGMVFFYKYHQVAIKEKEAELVNARALNTVLKVLFLPELSCTRGDAEPEAHCFDLGKVRYVNLTFKEHTADYYIQLFSFARISIHQLYPEQKEYILYDKSKPVEDGQEPDRTSTFFVVALRDAIQGEGNPYYNYGYLNVTVFS